MAHLVDVVILPQERHQGHAHRLLAAFEGRAAEAGAHVAEFWTDDGRSEGLLAALGWHRIYQRGDYIGHRSWSLMEKRLSPDPGSLPRRPGRQLALAGPATLF